MYLMQYFGLSTSKHEQPSLSSSGDGSLRAAGTSGVCCPKGEGLCSEWGGLL